MLYTLCRSDLLPEQSALSYLRKVQRLSANKPLKHGGTSFRICDPNALNKEESYLFASRIDILGSPNPIKTNFVQGTTPSGIAFERRVMHSYPTPVLKSELCSWVPSCHSH